jgi:hypothetical protein
MRTETLSPVLLALTLSGCSVLFPQGTIEVEWSFQSVAGIAVPCPVGEVKVIARDVPNHDRVLLEWFTCADGSARVTVPVNTGVDDPPLTSYDIAIVPTDGVTDWAWAEKGAGVTNGGEAKIAHTFITDGGYAVLSIRMLNLFGAAVGCFGPPIIETLTIGRRGPDQTLVTEEHPCTSVFTSEPLVAGRYDYTVTLRDSNRAMVAGSQSAPVIIEDRDRRTPRELEFRIQD